MSADTPHLPATFNRLAWSNLAAQLLSVSAFKPMIDKILSEAGFAAGPDALTSLTNALAQRKAELPAEAPATSDGIRPETLVGTITGQLGTSPKSP